jgi:transposase-like protein
MATRRSYSITEKLAVLAQYEPNVQGSGFRALGVKHGISPSNIRGWWSNKEKLLAASRDRQVATRTSRRLTGGGRRPVHNELDEKLYAWVSYRNNKRLRLHPPSNC